MAATHLEGAFFLWTVSICQPKSHRLFMDSAAVLSLPPMLSPLCPGTHSSFFINKRLKMQHLEKNKTNTSFILLA